MPLYGRRLFHPPPSQSQGSFVIPHTGQTFDQADIYQKLVQVYALERWTCECTWRASLTHAEALRSEIDTRRTLTSLVPEHFYKPIFDVIHHNVKPLEKLAEEVSIVLSQSFVLSEPVQFRKKRKDSEVLRGVIERIDDPDESKKRQSIQLTPTSDKQMKNVKYTVRLLDADGTMIEDVSSAELQRTHPVPNREKLKTFIRSFAIRLGTRVDSPWIFYDHSIVSRYKVPSRLPPPVVEQFQKSMTISVDEILREQERLARKQAEVVVPPPMITESTNDDDQVIILSDDEDIEKIFPKKFPSARTFELVVPRAMLNRLEKIRRERGADSKGFQRLILQCARTLSDEQRENFPAEYRSLIQSKVEDLALKQRISQMTDEEKKQFFQTKREEQKPIEDLDLTQTKDLPEGKPLETALDLSMDSIGDLLMIGMFLSSCQTLFTRTLNDDELSKFLRSFQLDSLLKHFPQSFGKLAQIFLRLLFKEEENRQSIVENDDDEDASTDTNNNPQPSDFEEIYSTKFTDIPLNSFTCQELTRLFLLKDRPESSAPLLVVERLATCEMTDLPVAEQVELLKMLVETIYTNNEILSDHQEYLTRILGEAARERQQLLAERREEQNQKKKLRLQNGNEPTGDDHDPLITINDENDLKTVLQRRRQMLAVSKELKEKKEQQNQKLHIEQRKQLALQRAEQAYQDALLNVQQSFRLKPLGHDRFYNRYWFFRGHAGLFLEKGWSEASSQWFVLDDESQINELLQSLNDRGVREHHLLLNLRKSMPLIQHEFDQMKKTKTTPPNSDEGAEKEEEEEGMIASFRSELEEIESRLRLGSLGGWMNNLDELSQWQKKLSKATERHELAELLIQLEETVPEKYSSGIFNQSEKKSLEFWINDCRSCSTYSRLYVLMMVFENAIQWNKSPVGMKCKVCRKKYKDESMFVCDQCYHAYHPQCLKIARPISNDLWYCPACRPEPISKRRQRQESSSSSSSEEEEEGEEEEEIESSSASPSSRESSISDDDPRCSVCGSDGEIFPCHQCEQFYHCDCHQPPLRCPPRSNQWLCNTCRTGSKVNKSKKTTKTTKRKAKRKKPEETSQGRRRSKRLRPSASSYDEEQIMDESDH